MLFHFIEAVATTTTLGLLSPHPRFYLFRQPLPPLISRRYESSASRSQQMPLNLFPAKRITEEGGVQANSNDLLNQKLCVGHNLVLEVFQKTHIRK